MANRDPEDEITDELKELVNAAEDNPWIGRMVRLGHATRGVLYGMVGFLAIQLILTGRGKLTGRQGVLATIAGQPLGKFLLIIIAIGLMGLALWGILSATVDFSYKGSDTKGIIKRFGDLVVGFSYGVLLIPTIGLITGKPALSSGSNNTAQQATTGILTKPWGPWLVGFVGLVIIGVGGYEIYRGWSASFVKRFDAFEMTASQREWVIRMGQIGYIARGIVFITIGILAILGAVTLNPQDIGGTDSALTFLLRLPFGPWLLGAVALGLMAYAIYSIMGAFWFKMKGSD